MEITFRNLMDHLVRCNGLTRAFSTARANLNFYAPLGYLSRVFILLLSFAAAVILKLPGDISVRPRSSLGKREQSIRQPAFYSV